MSEKVIDPVCGMAVNPRDAPERRLYRGHAHHFCGIGCAGKFDQAPERYVGDGPRGHDIEHAKATGTALTRDPVCGMDVEPHNLRPASDLRDDQWRVVVAHMRVRADLTGQEARDVLKFLQESN